MGQGRILAGILFVRVKQVRLIHKLILSDLPATGRSLETFPMRGYNFFIGRKKGRSGFMSQKVLVLNATYEPLNVCTVKRAIVLMLKKKAQALELSSRSYHSVVAAFPVPNVIMLNYYVRVPRGDVRKVSRRAVLARDSNRCQYCGSRSHLTIDHVLPRSRGGTNSWENIVTSCAPCNARKGDRLPREADMVLKAAPRPPDPLAFVYMAVSEVHRSWHRYLEYAVA
jgi:5-methylcytosine-specific restriction endonuclease McrA